MYTELTRQATSHESKMEYDIAVSRFYTFFKDKRTKAILSTECILAAKTMQTNLCTKESKLANYLRMHIKNCMDAHTSSPAECNFRVIKKGKKGVNAKMSLNTSTRRIVAGKHDF
jgi:hypothetical protein